MDSGDGCESSPSSEDEGEVMNRENAIIPPGATFPKKGKGDGRPRKQQQGKISISMWN